MKDFRDLLTVHMESDHGWTKSEKHRILKAIEIGDYAISIQASYYHYCEPRTTLDNLKHYDTWEVAIFNKERWLNPKSDIEFEGFPDREDLHWEDGNCPVGGYIPTKTVQALYNHLESLSLK
jgi:hypothetical protein